MSTKCLLEEQQSGKCDLLGCYVAISSLKLSSSIHTSLCPIQGPLGKQGMQGLPGIDGPPVSTHKHINEYINIKAHKYAHFHVYI